MDTRTEQKHNQWKKQTGSVSGEMHAWLGEQKKPLPPKKTITWIQGNFPRSWSKGDVPFRQCQEICRRVNAGTRPHCEHTPWMSLFCEVGGWMSEGIRRTTWLENWKYFRWKTFTSVPAAERNTQTIFRWKMEAISRWKVKNFRTPPWRLSWCTRPTLKMHEMGRANLKRGGSLKHLTHFATEIWVSCCLDFWPIFRNIFRKNAWCVMAFSSLNDILGVPLPILNPPSNSCEYRCKVINVSGWQPARDNLWGRLWICLWIKPPPPVAWRPHPESLRVGTASKSPAQPASEVAMLSRAAIAFEITMFCRQATRFAASLPELRNSLRSENRNAQPAVEKGANRAKHPQIPGHKTHDPPSPPQAKPKTIWHVQSCLHHACM